MTQTFIRFRDGDIEGKTTANPFGWPPPERIYAVRHDHNIYMTDATKHPPLAEPMYVRVSMSNLTDDEVERHPGFWRGAEYRLWRTEDGL